MFQELYNKSVAGALALVEKDLVPDAVIRRGVRYLLAQRAKEVRRAAAAATAGARALLRLTKGCAQFSRPPQPTAVT